MRKAKVKANELKDAECSWISLVTRGANQIPHRVLKRHDGNKEGSQMISFDQSRLWKEDPKVPAIAGFIIRKGADVAKYRAALEKAGFKDFAKVEETDAGTVLHIAAESNGAEWLCVKHSDQFAVAVSGVSKAFYGMDFQSTDFKEVMANEGVIPSYRLATNILDSTCMNIFSKAMSPSEAASQIEKACNDFQNYVVEVVRSIPAVAFKLDVSLDGPAEGATGPASQPAVTPAAGETEAKPAESSVAKEEAKPEATEAKPAEGSGGGVEAAKPESAPATEVAKGDDKPAAEAKPEAAAAETVVKAEGEVKAETPAATEVAKTEAAPAVDPMAQVLAAIASVKETVDKSVGAINTRVEQLAADVAAVKTQAQKAESTAKSVIAGTGPAVETAKAAETKPKGGVFKHFDTAHGLPDDDDDEK